MGDAEAGAGREEAGAPATAARIGLLAGPLLAVAVYVALPDAYVAGDGQAAALPHAARFTAALAAWMAVWWMTEAIPLYATSLLPLALLPLGRAAEMREAATPYAHPLIFLFMGGFLLALSMQRWGLDRRVALGVLRRVGARPRRVVAGFMGLTAVFSMWVSNTATAVMMLPIATRVIDLVGRGEGAADEGMAGEDARRFACALLLGIAYAASIGGVGTLIGTPPNLFMASFVQEHRALEIGFARWMLVGLPLVAVFLPLTWLLLTRLVFPVRARRIEGGDALYRRASASLGPVEAGERVTFVVFLCAAAAWITRPLLVDLQVGGVRPLAGLTDPGIAMLAALVLFVVPAGRGRGFVMDWDTALKLPWGLLLLFGGGLSLAAAIEANGVGAFLGSQVRSLEGVPGPVLVLAVASLVVFLTELTSNTATAATFIPILAGMAPSLGVDPLLLIVPTALAASCAFMLPVATPPNAVIFGSGRIRIADMVRAGLALNLLSIVLITALVYAVAMPVLAGDGP